MEAAKGRDVVLDFWRGTGISMVLFQHTIYYHWSIFRQFVETAAYTTSMWHNALLFLDHVAVAVAYRSGDLGVKFFFVVSGYIITSLLLREESKNGSISAKKFWIRRIFRIVPAYGVYLLFVCGFALIGWAQLNFAQVPYAAGLLCNTDLVACGWNIAHTWTLAIEEQFYIFWPIFFLLAPRRWRTEILVGLIGILLAFSSTGFLFAQGWIDNALCFVCIALGALYALKPEFRAWVQRWGLWASAMLLASILVIDKLPGMAPLAHLAFREVTPFFILVCIILTYRLPQLVQRSNLFILMADIGLISYSLYIWQAVFTNFPSGYPEYSPLLITPLVICVAIVSYIFIERPFIAWGKRLQQYL